MDANPYAPPLAEPDPPVGSGVGEVGLREIAAMSNVFSFIGGTGIAFGCLAVFFAIVIGISAVANPAKPGESSIEALPVLGAAIVVLFSSGAAFLVGARKLKDAAPIGWPFGIGLSLLLLTIFPFFTPVGAICLWKIVRHFPTYRRLVHRPAVGAT